MMATQLLRQQHRHIEQGLALLEEQSDDCESEFEALVVELTAHLAAEMDVFYRAAEAALGQPLAEQRRHHEHLHKAVSRAERASGEPASFPRRLFDLAETFKAHARLEERAIHPSIEGLMGQQELEVLGTHVAAFQAAVASALRSAGRPSPSKA